MKKLFSILLACIIICINMIPAMAAETKRERVTIEINTLADIDEFYKSPVYDNNKQYSFIIKNPPAFRTPCPNCGSAAWTGSGHRADEVDMIMQECPQGGSMDSDQINVFHYTYLERCRSCGYEIPHDEFFFKILCVYLPEWAPLYEAWDGQSWEAGDCDIHEDKSVWYKASKYF